MSITRDTFKNGVDIVADTIKKGMSHLHGNDAVNPIGKAMLTPVAVASDMWRTKSVIDPLTNAYMKTAVKDEAGKVVLQDGVNLGNIAGSYLTIGLSAGIAGGLTHDTAGNTDIAGIPMI